jgi:uncharacterized protein (TIGR00251 family)
MTRPKRQPGWYRWQDDDLVLNLRVQPRAGCDELGEPVGPEIRVRITAPPADGQANEHLCRFLARLFRVPRSRVELVSGKRSRIKRVRVRTPRRLPAPLSGL